MAKADSLRGSIPMLVLALINERDMYGYEIIKELKRKSEDVFALRGVALPRTAHA